VGKAHLTAKGVQRDVSVQYACTIASTGRRQSRMDTFVDGKVQRIQAMLYAKASEEPGIRG